MRTRHVHMLLCLESKEKPQLRCHGRSETCFVTLHVPCDVANCLLSSAARAEEEDTGQPNPSGTYTHSPAKPQQAHAKTRLNSPACTNPMPKEASVSNSLLVSTDVLLIAVLHHRVQYRL